MEESATPPPALPHRPEELHWGIVYLREDIQDVRGEIRGVHNRIDQTQQHLDEVAQQIRSELRTEIGGVHNRIDQTQQQLSSRIDQTNQHLDEVAQGIRAELRTEIQGVHNRIDQTYQRLDGRIDQTHQRLDEKYELLIKRLDNRFLWTITTMIALSGLAVTILKM